MAVDPELVPLAVAGVALLVGVLTTALGVATLWQKHRADRREALWERSRVAITLSQSQRPVERQWGTDMILALLDQPRLPPTDAALLVLAAEAAVAEGAATGAGDDEVAAALEAAGDAEREAGHDETGTGP